MLDRNFIRDSLDHVRERLSRKGFEFDLNGFEKLDKREKSLRIENEELRALRNQTSEQISLAKRKGEDASPQITEMKRVSDRIKELDRLLSEVGNALFDFLAGIPNLPHETVPVGKDETANEVVRLVGEVPQFDFEPRDHVELGQSLGILDPDRAAKITGARFANYYGAGALLERALMNFMLDIHTREHGYLEMIPPFMANRRSFFGTGNLPKFEADLFKVDGTDYLLIPTAEVPVTNVFGNEILDEDELPCCLTAHTPCFRSEAGAHGRDTRGLIRQHQFNKVELVHFCKPEDSYDQLEILTANAETILKRLDLPYRVVVLSSGDMSFSSAKTYDIEVWVPSQKTYREISSCSNFEDFQARRANIRCRSSAQKKTRFAHTLNGSGLAIGRTWVAIVENYQQEDGSIAIPEALQSYMGGLERISARDPGLLRIS
jgi:seryl-tRNA synthetase